MKIEAVRVAFPSRKLTNRDIVDLIRENSAKTFSGDLEQTLKKIGAFLRYSGAIERYWLDKGEKPINLLSRAMNEALTDANCKKEEIDTLIYTGVDRGFVEPANAYFVAKSMGISKARCFDVADACMSWTTALSLLDCMFKQGVSKRAMVVNAEFNQTHENWIGYPKIFRLQSPDQVPYTFPGFTVGEAATATILSADENKWDFHFSQRSDLAHLCMSATKGADNYINTPEDIPEFERFVSFGIEMHQLGSQECVNIFRELKTPRNQIKAVFPHASSKKAWEEAAKQVGADDKMYFIYPKYGNLVSASVPAALSLATTEGRIKRGDTLAGWVGSAGMSFAAYSFKY